MLLQLLSILKGSCSNYSLRKWTSVLFIKTVSMCILLAYQYLDYSVVLHNTFGVYLKLIKYRTWPFYYKPVYSNSKTNLNDFVLNSSQTMFVFNMLLKEELSQGK